MVFPGAEKVDVVKMAEAFKTSVEEIEGALGLLPECPAETIEAVREIYFTETAGSPEHEAAEIKWDVLCMEEIEQAYTFEEIKTAYGRTREGSMARREAEIRWDEITKKFIPQNPEKAYDEARPESEAKQMALEYWITTLFSSNMVTVSQARKVYSKTKLGSKVRRQVICLSGMLFEKK